MDVCLKDVFKMSPSIVVSSWALAAESVDAVNTFAAVGTWVGQTFVDVGLAVLAREAGDALARVSVRQRALVTYSGLLTVP